VGTLENDSAIPLIFHDPAFSKRLDFDFKNDSIRRFFVLRTTRFRKAPRMHCYLRYFFSEGAQTLAFFVSASESVSYAVSGLRQDRRSRYGPLANMVEIKETQQNIDQVRRGQALGDGEPDSLSDTPTFCTWASQHIMSRRVPS
jgi:hypothetical protein